MTCDVVVAYENDTVEEIASLMVENDINRIPVLDEEGRIAGIISRADIIRYIAKGL